jgi:hypothetical protein
MENEAYSPQITVISTFTISRKFLGATEPIIPRQLFYYRGGEPMAPMPSLATTEISVATGNYRFCLF